MNMNDLKSLKKELRASFFVDGLYDITFALLLLFFGIVRLTLIISDLIWGLLILLISPIVLISTFFITKRYFVPQRSGIIKFKKMTKNERIPLVIMVCAMSAYVVLKIVLDFNGVAAAICYGFLFGISFASAAHNSGVKRFYIVAILLGISFCLYELSDAVIINIFVGPIAFMIFGTIYALYGIVVFSKFLRENPIQKP